ncbi:serine/threonine-protein kinase [Saccharothrix variisporea]|uniref:Serine/threonine protein kinase n=1 Tax=Saccharothrix variisporea TaxID=543527 RepID=A0A495X7Z5_9PSEU|nr:serine/threonine-protein kinase [Saccharothrix variisporea]RKT69285.1 serine/threonine protein kinase [Saccharothrix variisporea]
MSAAAERELLAGRYRLGELLGSGGAGEVRRAWDTTFNRPVAVKIVRWDAGGATRRRFRHEVRTLAGLQHPGVVSVLDAGTDGSRSFVVMRLVDGGTLRDRMAVGAMDVDTVRELGAHIAEALDHVHARGIVHRDITPANILLDDRGRPHLADFGLARLPDSPQLTKTGHVMGTAAYLAPEQVRGQDITTATDIYALGLVLLECLTGHREFPGGRAEAAAARLHRPPHLPADLPDDLTRLLGRMTSLVPHRRPTAADCAHTLRYRDLRA